MALHLDPTFRERIASGERAQIGLWAVSGSPLVAEVLAGSGADWLLIDMEHSANTLASVQLQLQAVAAYDVAPVVRVPFGDPVMIKQVLDLGAQNILVPMVNTVEQAEQVVQAVRYPPLGVRGIGSALSRSARWNRVDGYLANADDHTSLFVQIESAQAVENAAEIAAVNGVDGVFVGPADLAGSMGVIGQQTHPEVLAAVYRTFDAVRAAGKAVGVNAFDIDAAQNYIERGASFVAVAADVSILARQSEAVVARFAEHPATAERSGY